MKQFQRIFKYLGEYKGKIALYFLFILLSILFSMVSLAMLAPFLKLLFNQEDLLLTEPVFSLSAKGILDYMMYNISMLIKEKGTQAALAFICVIIICSILFKNVFLYLSYRTLAPMRNGVLTRLRGDLYDKVLQLPIGWLADRMSRQLLFRGCGIVLRYEWQAGTAPGARAGLVRQVGEEGVGAAGAAARGLAIVTRGSGTGLSGGLPARGRGSGSAGPDAGGTA